jgi:plastocyanin
MRERLVLPILIPVGAALTILLLIVSGSKLLLEISPEVATVVAIAIAVGILAVSTFLAMGPRLRAPQVYAITALPISVLLAVGLYLVVQPQPKTAGEGGAAVEVVTTINEVATDNVFSIKAINVPVGQEITLNLDNKGQAAHNWNLTGVAGDPKTDIISGGQQATVKFTIDKAGTFNFKCDVHPAEMTGKITAIEGAVASGPSNSPEVTATDNKFNPNTLTFAANQPVKVTLNNKGAAAHNIHFIGVKDPSGKDVAGAILAGGQSETIEFDAPAPGTYKFQCDVHPAEMTGSLTVQ